MCDFGTKQLENSLKIRVIKIVLLMSCNRKDKLIAVLGVINQLGYIKSIKLLDDEDHGKILTSKLRIFVLFLSLVM